MALSIKAGLLATEKKYIREAHITRMAETCQKSHCHIEFCETVFHWGWFAQNELKCGISNHSWCNFLAIFIQNIFALSALHRVRYRRLKVNIFLWFHFDDLLMFDWIPLARFPISILWVSDLYLLESKLFLCFWSYKNKTTFQVELKNVKVFRLTIEICQWKCSKNGFIFNELKNFHILYQQTEPLLVLIIDFCLLFFAFYLFWLNKITIKDVQ